MTKPGRHTPISQRFTSQANERPSSPCERLWREVIDCAFRDAVDPPARLLTNCTTAQLQRQRDRISGAARHWLLFDESDFAAVCDLAGRDPLEVRDRARKLLRNPELAAAYAAAPRAGQARLHNRQRIAS